MRLEKENPEYQVGDSKIFFKRVDWEQLFL